MSTSEPYIKIAQYNLCEMLSIPIFFLLFLSILPELKIKQNQLFDSNT